MTGMKVQCCDLMEQVREVRKQHPNADYMNVAFSVWKTSECCGDVTPFVHLVQKEFQDNPDPTENPLQIKHTTGMYRIKFPRDITIPYHDANLYITSNPKTPAANKNMDLMSDVNITLSLNERDDDVRVGTIPDANCASADQCGQGDEIRNLTNAAARVIKDFDKLGDRWLNARVKALCKKILRDTKIQNDLTKDRSRSFSSQGTQQQQQKECDRKSNPGEAGKNATKESLRANHQQATNAGTTKTRDRHKVSREETFKEIRKELKLELYNIAYYLEPKNFVTASQLNENLRIEIQVLREMLKICSKYPKEIERETIRLLQNFSGGSPCAPATIYLGDRKKLALLRKVYWLMTAKHHFVADDKVDEEKRCIPLDLIIYKTSKVLLDFGNVFSETQHEQTLFEIHKRLNEVVGRERARTVEQLIKHVLDKLRRIVQNADVTHMK